MQSRNILPKKIKEQLGKSKTRKGRLRQKGASRRIENPKGQSGQKLETLKRKIIIPIDRKPERAIYTKIRETWKDNCIRSTRPLKTSLADRRLQFEASAISFLHIEFKVVRRNRFSLFSVPFPFIYHFSKLCNDLGVMLLAGYHSINKIEPMAFFGIPVFIFSIISFIVDIST